MDNKINNEEKKVYYVKKIEKIEDIDSKISIIENATGFLTVLNFFVQGNVKYWMSPETAVIIATVTLACYGARYATKNIIKDANNKLEELTEIERKVR